MNKAPGRPKDPGALVAVKTIRFSEAEERDAERLMKEQGTSFSDLVRRGLKAVRQGLA